VKVGSVEAYKTTNPAHYQAVHDQVLVLRRMLGYQTAFSWERSKNYANWQQFLEVVVASPPGLQQGAAGGCFCGFDSKAPSCCLGKGSKWSQMLWSMGSSCCLCSSRGRECS
jgi:hypothetical protein